MTTTQTKTVFQVFYVNNDGDEIEIGEYKTHAEACLARDAVMSYDPWSFVVKIERKSRRFIKD